MISSKSRFHRIVSKLARCKKIDREEIPDYFLKLMEEKEDSLGLYRANDQRHKLFFTSDAIYFIQNSTLEPMRIAYKDLQSIKFPLPISESTELRLILRNGDFVEIDVIGRDGTYRDVFEVGRFLMRVMEDQIKNDGAAAP